MDACPHCSAELPLIVDAFCPYCNESLQDLPSEQTLVVPAASPDSWQRVHNDANPFASPNDHPQTKSGTVRLPPGVILYTDLPKICPGCNRKFAEANYHQRFKRRLRWSTIAYMVGVCFAGFLMLSLGTMFFWATLFMIIIPLLAKARNWPKVVKMSCYRCPWKKNFLVAARGG